MEKLSGYKEAIKGITFPAKTWMNKTSTKVVEERKVNPKLAVGV